VGVSATLDPARRPDCRGRTFQDPGGWGLLRFDGGLVATFDAADYARIPATIALNGSKGRAITGAGDVTLEFWNSRTDHWPTPAGPESSMDRAMAEIVAWLDGKGVFPDSAEDSVRTLETIMACHASHRRDSAWVPLPLAGLDRNIELRSG
jgi:hypothetical protein